MDYVKMVLFFDLNVLPMMLGRLRLKITDKILRIR